MYRNLGLREIMMDEFAALGIGGGGAGLGEPGYAGRTAGGPPIGWTPNPQAWDPYYNPKTGRSDDPFYTTLPTIIFEMKTDIGTVIATGKPAESLPTLLPIAPQLPTANGLGAAMMPPIRGPTPAAPSVSGAEVNIPNIVTGTAHIPIGTGGAYFTTSGVRKVAVNTALDIIDIAHYGQLIELFTGSNPIHLHIGEDKNDKSAIVGLIAVNAAGIIAGKFTAPPAAVAIGGVRGVGAGEQAISMLGPELKTSLQSEFSSAIPLPERNGMGYATFKELKAALGEYPGYEWHHIVEQHPSNLSRFGPYMIHNTRNVRLLAYFEHRPISAFYSRTIAKGGLTFREVVRTWTFEAQHDFGIRVLMKTLKEL